MSVTGLLVSVGVLLCCGLCVSCAGRNDDESGDRHEKAREAMVATVHRYGVRDERILTAMRKVRRHLFIPKGRRLGASPYGDHPCPIGHGQTISQPYIVAYMTEQLKLKAGEKVLEIGTGSGYQAAILAEMGVEVFSIEIVKPLADHARNVLTDEGYSGIKLRTGDGYKGWPDHAPFDAVIVTCAPESVPQALVDQLRDGGRMIVPVGRYAQRLVILRKEGGKVVRVNDLAVRFVPMVHGEEKAEE